LRASIFPSAGAAPRFTPLPLRLRTPPTHTHTHTHSSRIFLIGPSHHVYSRKCFLSTAHEYATPLGPLPIDAAVVAELHNTNEFESMPIDVDEAEHSLELHTSFIAHVMRGRNFTLVPIMAGALSVER
jgi:MEMO1 family protein